MAIIELGTTVVGIRGSIGGITFSANKAGPHAKIKTRGANPRTTLQATQRNRNSANAQAWRGLTAAQRTAWNVYAALPAQQLFNSLGLPYFVSGFAWYVSCSNNLVAAGAVAIPTAPVLAIPAAPTVSSFAFRSTAFGFDSVIRTNLADPNKLMLKAGKYIVYNSLGRAVADNKIPLMAVKQVTIGGAADGFWPFQTEATARFGTLIVGQIGFFKLYNQNAEGRRSAAWVSGGSALV